ncbi:BQ2448_1061 [Microbotryum intermedium]|uniref:Diphthamide biosynthesis protein 4 n=1 Tax=Microbotryum intermedium TaxID=269621 RepID=A0A238F953_9BASI|nr:BQ2448_1061 [Microbotryum intermedium]
MLERSSPSYSLLPGSKQSSTLEAALNDHYATLHVPPTADLPTIRAAYRALILLHHPDRATTIEGINTTPAQALNEAWRVLGDLNRREAYDREYMRQQRKQEVAPSSLAYAVSIDLSFFTPHYSEGTSAEPEAEDSLIPLEYTHLCRCSAQFRITLEQLEEGVHIVQCEGCSERCKVEYQVVESGDENQQA